MARIGSAYNLTTFLILVNVAYVIMPELDQNEITRLNTVVNFLPAILVQIRAATASSFGTVGYCDFAFIEYCWCLTAPTPHAVQVFIFVLYRAVAGDEYDGFPFLTPYAYRRHGERLDTRL